MALQCDAIIKVTSSAICGSDLHLYVNAMPGMTKHDVLGHEFMGIVEDVGPEVSAEWLSLGNTCTGYGHVDSQLQLAQVQQPATAGQEFACS